MRETKSHAGGDWDAASVPEVIPVCLNPHSYISVDCGLLPDEGVDS